ncbi:MAG: hypothetical protein ACK4ML_00760 [Alishewanella aestuarii]
MLTKIVNLLFKNIASRFVVEALLAILRRISWAEVLERLLMRVIKRALRKLASMTANTVDDKLVEDIIASLEKRSLPKVD